MRLGPRGPAGSIDWRPAAGRNDPRAREEPVLSDYEKERTRRAARVARKAVRYTLIGLILIVAVATLITQLNG